MKRNIFNAFKQKVSKFFSSSKNETKLIKKSVEKEINKEEAIKDTETVPLGSGYRASKKKPFRKQMSAKLKRSRRGARKISQRANRV